MSLINFTHPCHPLYPVDLNAEFLCNGCNTLGYGRNYWCNICDYRMHECCATGPQCLQSHVHPKHKLSLMCLPVAGLPCKLCGDLVHGLCYACQKCTFHVHPLCIQLPKEIMHMIHPFHALTLQDSKPSVCLVCRYPCLAWRYTCKKCDVHIHMECANYSANSCDLKKPPVGPSWASPSPYVYYPSGMMMPSFHNQQAQSSGSNGGYFRKKIYSIVAGLAANVIVASVTGIPAFPFL